MGCCGSSGRSQPTPTLPLLPLLYLVMAAVRLVMGGTMLLPELVRLSIGEARLVEVEVKLV